jgi:hypothetical protein
MPQLKYSLVVLAVAVAAMSACSDGTAPESDNATDTSLATDLATSAGDAIASAVGEMVDDEQFSSMSADIAMDGTTSGDDGVTRSRTRTCYDAGGSVVTCGEGLTASALVELQLDGSWAGENFTAVVHRQLRDSVSGIGSESTSRTHNGYGASQDTATYNHNVTTRVAAIAASDSVVDLVFDLPHANNPWPVSCQVIRNVDASFTLTRGATKTRNIVRRAVVTFPADAQGNVSLELGTLSCTLNLVTHKVTACTGS